MSEVQRCYTCKHWQGDRAKFDAWRCHQLGEFGHEPLEKALDPRTGWAPEGDCPELRAHLDILLLHASYSSGASVEVVCVPAGFGCVLWEKTDDDA